MSWIEVCFQYVGHFARKMWPRSNFRTAWHTTDYGQRRLRAGSIEGGRKTHFMNLKLPGRCEGASERAFYGARNRNVVVRIPPRMYSTTNVKLILIWWKLDHRPDNFSLHNSICTILQFWAEIMGWGSFSTPGPRGGNEEEEENVMGRRKNM